MMNKREIRKELNKILKRFNAPSIRVSNYHYEEEGTYYNDIEIQVRENGYLDTIIVDSIEIHDFDRTTWYETIEVQDKSCLKTKKDIFKWLTNNYDMDTFGIELALKGDRV